MTADCPVCEAARENYRNAVLRESRVSDDADAAKRQKADDHVWLCLDDCNHAEGDHAMGRHADAAVERVA